MMPTADFKSPRILEVKPGDGDYVVSVSWDDGTTSRIDLTELIFRLKHLRPLRNKQGFKKVKVEDYGWSISWGDDLDLSGEMLWELSQEQQSSVIMPSAFRAWMKQHGITQEEAADLLGVSKRIISYYATGAQPITRTVALAMKGLDAEIVGGKGGGFQAASEIIEQTYESVNVDFESSINALRSFVTKSDDRADVRTYVESIMESIGTTQMAFDYLVTASTFIDVLRKHIRGSLLATKTLGPDYIICLEDGIKLSNLKEHLWEHHRMSFNSYLVRWNLPEDYPVAARRQATVRRQD